MKHVTLPPFPWDNAKQPVEAEKPYLLEPAPLYVRKLILDMFAGEIGKEDLLYMAKALLQMSDEIFELRARIEGMEMAIKAQSTGIPPNYPQGF